MNVYATTKERIKDSPQSTKTRNETIQMIWMERYTGHKSLTCFVRRTSHSTSNAAKENNYSQLLISQSQSPSQTTESLSNVSLKKQ